MIIKTLGEITGRRTAACFHCHGGKKVMKVWIGILLVAGMLTLSGCFDMPSVYPLYTDQTAVAEPRLVGAWQTKDGKEQMFVNLTGDREYRLAYIDDKGEATQWKLRVVKLSATSVADMLAVKATGIPVHHFLALSFDGPVLKAWYLDSSPLREKAAKEGLAYVHGKKDEVVVTAPTASLAAFLEKNLGDELKKNADLELLPVK
jgi:hypothetical protein